MHTFCTLLASSTGRFGRIVLRSDVPPSTATESLTSALRQNRDCDPSGCEIMVSSTRARSAHRTATPVIDDWSSDPVLLATVPCLKEGKGRKEGREGRKEAFMVCEKGGLQLWDCTRSSRRRIHQPLALKTATVCTTLTRGYIQFTVWVFCRLNHQPCESMKACEICLRAEDGRWWIPAGYGCLKPAAVRRMGVVRTQRGQCGSASGFHTGGGRWWCETAGG